MYFVWSLKAFSASQREHTGTRYLKLSGGSIDGILQYVN
ncbi:hypothetical protein AmDm5_2703 [Acetobacter malorum]|nr:hypothetical protein AmDm5_2703 [Acetobacter malorum]